MHLGRPCTNRVGSFCGYVYFAASSFQLIFVKYLLIATKDAVSGNAYNLPTESETTGWKMYLWIWHYRVATVASGYSC